MPSSSSSTLVERVGLKPRMPMFGRRPKPSSSRTCTPATFRSASFVVITRLFSSVSRSTMSTDPGRRRSRSWLPAISPATTTTSSVRPPTRSCNRTRRFPRARRHALQRDGEAAPRGHLVIARLEPGDRKRAFRVDFDAVLECGRRAGERRWSRGRIEPLSSATCPISEAVRLVPLPGS